MINVKITRKKSNYIYSFEIKGHAGYSVKGYDIICSAVSVLTINTINTIEKLTLDKIEYTANEDGGYMFFCLPSVKNNKLVSKEANILLESLELGLRSIEQEYGKKYIMVINEEV